MKKLVSIFAALAMVGALAAQKRKAPAKAPAKPAAVAAPAVPAAVTAPAPVVAAPAASGKGLGLSIEARGAWIQSHGTSDSQADGDTSTAIDTYKLSNSNGFGGGLTIGYAIAKNLGIVASYDYRAISSRKWEQKSSATATTTIQNTVNTQVIGIGLRPTVDAFGGSFYAGMGFAMVLPFDSTTTVETTLTAGAPGTAKREDKSAYNLGLGVYAELGYNYAITENLFAGIGIRGLVATSNNDGKSMTRTVSGNATTATAVGFGALGSTVTNYKSTVDAGDATQAAYGSNGITDMTVSVTVGYRL